MASTLTISVVSGNNVNIGTNIKSALDALSLAGNKVYGYSTAASGDKIIATILYDTA